jgi:hypothetical protein
MHLYSNRPRRTTALLTSAIALLCLAKTGCGTVNADGMVTAYEAPTAEQLAEDSKYMVQTFKDRSDIKSVGFAPVDLADEKQYNYVVRRLLRSGNTPETAPHLFEKIEGLRKRALSKDTPEDGLGVAESALNSVWCGQFIDPKLSQVFSHITPAVGGGFKSVYKTQASTRALVTCFGGADYVYEDVTTYETDANETYYTELAYAYAEEYAGGIHFKDAATLTSLSNDVGKYHLMESLAIATDDATGNSSVTFALFEAEANSIPAKITLTHPKEWNGGAPIRSCIKRANWVGNGDCDYASIDHNGSPTLANPVGLAKMVNVNGEWKADSDPANRWIPAGFTMANLYLPLAGTFDAGKRNGSDCIINNYDEAVTTTIVTLKQTGGWCSPGLPQHSKDVFNNIKNKTGARTATFNVLGNFGPDCLGNTQETDVLTMIKANATCGATSTARIGVLSPQALGTVDFRNSCFAAGTGVMLEDGRYVAVESVKPGDGVLADGSGLRLSVTSVARGGELHPMVRLHDSKGHDLLLTEKHPVATSEGLVPADKLKEGMEVETESGMAVLTSVERVPYDGVVYNLTLGTAEELGELPLTRKTMFAGGIRVGDNDVQRELEIESLRPKRELAAAWAADYEKDRARSGKIRLAE